jgi:hypothetical protein
VKLGDQEFDLLNCFDTKQSLAKLFVSRAVKTVVQFARMALRPARIARGLPLEPRF